MSARRAVLALLAASGAFAAIGASGCQPQGKGSQSKTFSGEQARVSNAISAIHDAYNDEQKDRNGARTVCRTLLSKRLVAQLDARGGCEKLTRKALKDADPIPPDVQSVTVRGDRATAKVRIRVDQSDERTDTLTLVRQGTNNSWRLDGSTPGPPKKSK